MPQTQRESSGLEQKGRQETYRQEGSKDQVIAQGGGGGGQAALWAPCTGEPN